MTCSGCEERREWIRKQTKRAELRMRKLLQQLSFSTAGDNQQSKPSNDSSDQQPR